MGLAAKRTAGACALLLAAALFAPAAVADAYDQAKRLHDRIAGVPPDDDTLVDMASDIQAGRALDAALTATEAPEFYNVTLKNFAAPWTNRERSVFVPLNDYIATVIGIVRDEIDFREVLSGDILYLGFGSGIPPYSNFDNAHYQALISATPTCCAAPPNLRSPACRRKRRPA